MFDSDCEPKFKQTLTSAVISRVINETMICLNAFRRLSTCLSPPKTVSLAVSGLRAQAFHKTSVNFDVMEFFDDPKNWGESEVKTGLLSSRVLITDCHRLSSVVCVIC